MTFFLVIHCCSTNFVVLVNKASPSFFPHLSSIQSFSIFPRFVTLQSQSVVHSMKLIGMTMRQGEIGPRVPHPCPIPSLGSGKPIQVRVGSGKVGGI